MQEKHEFGLVIAKNKLEAKNIAKSKWLIGCKKKHKDDLASLEMIISCDDCEKIKKIGNWQIELIPDNNFIQEKFTFPCACLVFGLIGSILGSKSNLRSSKSQGFGLSVLLILVYYVMSFICSSFGVTGLLPPIIAAWFPVVISLGGGFYFLRKSSYV